MDYNIIFTIKEPYNVEYTTDDISLGTEIKETFDKSYDTASLTLPLTSVATEYQPYTPVKLFIFNADESIDMDMLIESDTVIDEYIGDTVKYTHQIVLIEGTKKLETIMMPNMTFTQPSTKITLDRDGFVPANDITYGPETADTQFKVKEYDGFKWHDELATPSAKRVYLYNAPGIWLGSKSDGTTYNPTCYRNDERKDTIDATLSPSWDNKNATFTKPTDMKKYIHIGGKLDNFPINPIIYTIVNSYDSSNHSSSVYSWNCAIRQLIYPSSVEFYKSTNTTNVPDYTIFASNKIEYKDTCIWYEYKGFSSLIDLPDSIPAGKYRIKYRYSLDTLYRRNLNIPTLGALIPAQFWGDYVNTLNGEKVGLVLAQLTISAPKYIPTDYSNVYFSNGSTMSVREYMDKYAYVEVKNVEIVGDDNPSTYRYKLSDLLTKIEKQITPTQLSLIGTASSTGTEGTDTSGGTPYKTMLYTYRVSNIDSIKLTAHIIFNEHKQPIDVVFYQIKFYNSNNELIRTDVNEPETYRSTNPISTDEILYDCSVPYGTTKIQVIGYTYGLGTKYGVDFGKAEVEFYVETPSMYHFSDNVINIASKMEAPEYVWEGKTLWEICLDIGETLHAIPYLRNGNIIDYLYINNNTKKDTPELLSKYTTIDMTNYATKLYTPTLTKLTDDNENSMVYPCNGGWTTVRAKNYSDNQINRTTSVICIDNENTGIYKINKVEVKYTYNGETKITDITRYVVEKAIWDSLDDTMSTTLVNNQNVSEKGLYLYYVQGDKYIYNVAQLPNNGSLIGWKQTNLTIALMLSKLLGHEINKLSKNIFDYQFRITYVPYYTRLNIAHISNLNDRYHQITMNFNQTTNGVSTLGYGKLVENTLKKLGNSDLSIDCIATGLNDFSIGNSMEVNNNNYYVNVKTMRFDNQLVEENIELTKDNYKQNDRIAVSKEYRQYNIATNAVTRKTISKHYPIYVSTDYPVTYNNNGSYISDKSAGKTNIMRAFYYMLNSSDYSYSKFSSAYVMPMNDNGTALKYNMYSVPPKKAKNKIMPLNVSAIGNTLTMQFDMYDNFSAGRKAHNINDAYTKSWIEQRVDDVNNLLSSAGLTEGSFGIRVQDDCRYCDDNGNLNKMKVILFSPKSNISWSSSESSSLPDTTYTEKDILNNISQNTVSMTVLPYKDNREALSFQFELTCQTYDKDIRIKDIMSYCPLINRRKEIPLWYGYTNDNSPGIDDRTYSFSASDQLGYFVNLSTAAEPTITISVINLNGKNYDGYCLCYKDGTLLLDIHKPINDNVRKDVYMTIFNNELEYSELNTEVSSNFRMAKAMNTTSSLAIYNTTPRVYIDNDKLYIDPLSLNNCNPMSLSVHMGIRHNTVPRGIHFGYTGRAYRKHHNGRYTLLSNNWCDENGKYLFNDIYINENNEICYDYNGSSHNIMEYLATKKISKQDLHGSKMNKSDLSYYFTVSMDDISSAASNMITGIYDTETRLPETFISK